MDLKDLPARSGKDPRYPCVSFQNAPADWLAHGQLSDSELYYMFMMGELAAAELCAANVYEAEDLPWDFYRDMATQGFDEARHAEINRRWLEENDVEFSEMRGVNIYYDVYHELSLVGRLVALAVDGEARALDNQRARAQKAFDNGHEQQARSTERIMHEELRHVELSRRWTKILAGDLDEAVAMSRGELGALLDSFGIQQDNDKPSKSTTPVDRQTRLRAGFSEAELESEAKARGVAVVDRPIYLDDP